MFDYVVLNFVGRLFCFLCLIVMVIELVVVSVWGFYLIVVAFAFGLVFNVVIIL